ncbi:MAG: hypothetical protein EBX50_07690 [Chitinophagia bacterium]|nr:hypothetical protein [Chitinophagia bacterium]
MKTIRYQSFTFVLAALFFLIQPILAQQTTSVVRQPMVFSGSLGITNNGFSIIPSFSFNDPASVILLSWKKKQWSVDPEFRVTPTGKKGSILLWFRYHAIDSKRFTFRVGAHPAVNWFPATISENGTPEELLRLRRFFAWELAPTFHFSKNWSTTLYYLQGNGLQGNGPQTTHFVNLNSTISNIPLTKTLRFTIMPAIYYLYVDRNDGIFFTASASIGSTNSSFILQSTINQKIQSIIPDTKNFMWNVGVAYTFKRELRK